MKTGRFATRGLTLATLGLFGWAAGGAAPAPLLTFHTFVVSELYSSADGQVQFIELREASNFNGQNLLGGHSVVAENADGTIMHEMPFTTNLPSSNTAGKRVLIATANFASLPGGVTPDYIIPANFIFPSGRVIFAGLGGGANVTYTNLPTNGTSSFTFPGAATATNSPQNFATTTGSVDVPSGSCCIGAVCSVTSSLGCSGTFASGGACSPDPCAPPPTGACCNGTACSVLTAAACTGAGDTYKGDGVSCGSAGNPVACCPANFNASGGVTVQDIFDFLGAYFSQDMAADFNGQGGVTVQDIFDFLGAYFTGCPG